MMFVVIFMDRVKVKSNLSSLFFRCNRSKLSTFWIRPELFRRQNGIYRKETQLPFIF